MQGESCVSWVAEWPEVLATLESLASVVLADGAPTIILGVQRGGLVPAVVLSHLLGCRVSVIDIATTVSDEVGAQKNPPTIQHRPSRSAFAGQDVLVVDDVAGTARTIELAVSYVRAARPSRARSLVYYENQDRVSGSARMPIDYVGTSGRGWVVFPWEPKRLG